MESLDIYLNSFYNQVYLFPNPLIWLVVFPDDFNIEMRR